MKHSDFNGLLLAQGGHSFVDFGSSFISFWISFPARIRLKTFFAGCCKPFRLGRMAFSWQRAATVLWTLVKFYGFLDIISG